MCITLDDSLNNVDDLGVIWRYSYFFKKKEGMEIALLLEKIFSDHMIKQLSKPGLQISH